MAANRWQAMSPSQEAPIPLQQDLRAKARRRILSVFSKIEHRRWAISAFIYRIHPVRSEIVCFVLVFPSLALEALDRIKKTLENYLKQRKQLKKLREDDVALVEHLLHKTFSPLKDIYQRHTTPKESPEPPSYLTDLPLPPYEESLGNPSQQEAISN